MGTLDISGKPKEFEFAPMQEFSQIIERIRRSERDAFNKGLMVRTLAFVMRADERLMAKMGQGPDAIFENRTKAALARPLVQTDEGESYPSIEMLTLADYGVRHKNQREHVLGVLTDLLARSPETHDKAPRFGLLTVTQVNAWTPLGISPEELINLLKGRKEGASVAACRHADFLLAELYRYQAACHYWRAAGSKEAKDTFSAQPLEWAVLGGRLTPTGYGHSSQTAREVSEGMFKAVAHPYSEQPTKIQAGAKVK